MAWLASKCIFSATISRSKSVKVQTVQKTPCTYSPKNSTAVTETQMAITGLEILSMKIGMDSTAAAFANNRVTRSKWCFSTSGNILVACLFSKGFPPLWRTFKLSISSDNRPMVNPDIKPTSLKKFTDSMYYFLCFVTPWLPCEQRLTFHKMYWSAESYSI